MNKKELLEIERKLEEEDEYDCLTWGSKGTIRKLLKYIKYLKSCQQKQESK